MSQSGSLVFFTERRPQDPRSLLRATIAYVGAEQIRFAARFDPWELSWERFLAERDRPFEEVESAGGPGPFAFELESSKAHDLYEEGTTLMISFAGTRIEQQLGKPLQDQIPEAIRGRFVPCEPTVWMGRRDLFEAMEHPDGALLGRAWFCFALGSYDSPRNCEAYRHALFAMPEIKQLKHEIEAFAGPLEQCVHWSG